MSSMLKKPGGGAFKPKAPIARRRPAANLPTPSNTQSQGNQEQSKAASVQDANAGNILDGATPSNVTEAGTQSRQASSDVPARPTNAETSRTPQPVFSTPANENQSATPSQDQVSIDGTSREPEKESNSRNDARGSTVHSESENAPTASSNTQNIDQSSSAPRPVSESEYSPPASARAIATNPTPPATAPVTATAAPSAENSETLLNESTTATVKPTKSTAPRSRKRKAPAAAKESEAETGADTGAETGPEIDRPVRKRRTSRKKAATVDADGEDQADGAGNSGSTRPRPRRTGRKSGEGNNANVAENENEGVQQEAAPKRPKRRRKRSTTPEDAQEQAIDPETWTMAQLTKNLKMGKRWDRAKDVEAAERNRKRELQKTRLIKLGLLQEGEELPNGDGSEAGTPAPESAPPPKDPTPPPPPPMASTGISMRIDANGNIIVDESSLQHDRHREADMQRGTLLVQEENEFSKRVTQQTYMRRQPQGNHWTIEDTEKFYHGLGMFGTDFNMISKLFGGAKSRRQVKLKFNREERAHPVAVNKCLVGEKLVLMDLEEIHGAAEMEDSKTINEELARLREEREAEARRVEEEIAAEARRKREELFGKKKGRNHHLEGPDGDEANNDNEIAVEETDEHHVTNGRGGPSRQRSQQQTQEHPGAKYGVGTDPDVIDETDLPTASSSTGKGGRVSRGGRGGRRGGKAIFASGFGV